ncbi:MAG: asparagine synthase-related protein, partial [Terriglobia bacterium]
MNTYFVAKAAKAAGLSVVLSGLGGDELFWGYPGFHIGPRLGWWARLPGVRLGAAFIGAVGKHCGYDRLEKLEFLRESGALGPYLTLRGLFPPSRAARLLGSGVFPLALPDLKRESLTSSGYAELEIALYLQNQLLRDSDVFGMAHSLEIRVPFLDHRLAEFVFALPDSFKVSETSNKPLLLSALDGMLGPETVNRPKMGFTFPFERWMREHRAAIERRTDPGTTVHATQAKAIWDVFVKGRVHWSRPWALSALDGMTRLGNLPGLAQKKGGPEQILFLLPEVFSSKGGIPVYNQNLLRAVGETFPRSEMRVISVNDTAVPVEAAAFGRLHFIGCGPREPWFLKVRAVLTALRETLRHPPNVIICGHINLALLALLLS